MSSKIKVDTIENVAGSGNVSLGSGHNLVVPGDLTVDTSTLKVDSSNNRVGVGTASPTHPLSVNGQIKSTGSNGETVQLQTSSQYTGISFIGSDGTRDAIIDYDHTGGVMGIKAHTSAHKISMTTGGYSERLGISADGYVTKPNQPYFAAHMTGNSVYQSRSANHVFDFNTAIYNVGSHFDTSNHRFVAPVDGKYLFTVSFITNDSTPTARITFYVNGASQVNSLQFGISGSNTGGGGATGTSAIIQLSASDYVDVRSQAGTSQFYEDNHSSFTGILLA